MSNQLFIILALVCASQVTFAKNLPSSLRACSKSDANLEKCILDSGDAFIRSILNGEKEHKIPKLAPLSIESIGLNTGKDLTVKLDHVTVYGIDSFKFTSGKYDDAQKEINVKFAIPKINFTGNYEIHGRILVLPIEGKGYMEIVGEDGEFNSKLVYEDVDKDGVTYIKFLSDSSKLTADLKSATFRLDNLFNGDSTLGAEMQKFLSENWRDTDLLPALLEVINTILVSILNVIVADVPKDEIFLP